MSQSARQTQPAFQRFAARSADTETLSTFQDRLPIPSSSTVQGRDQIESHDCRAMDPEEPRRIESLRERVAGLADDVTAVAHVQLGIGSTCSDVVDVLYRYRSYISPDLDRDTFEVRLA